ncbi:MAG: DUF4340 domain-containing protein, partial [Pseudomonadota bacterium]
MAEETRDDQSNEKDFTRVSKIGLVHFDIKSQYGQISFEKRDQDWWVTDPFVYPANQELIERNLNVLGFHGAMSIFDKKEDRYGLDPSQGTLEFFYQNGSKLTLMVGSKEAPQNGVFVFNKASQKVAVVHNSWGQFLYAPIEIFFDPYLPLEGNQIKSVSLAFDRKPVWRVEPADAKHLRVLFGERTVKSSKAQWLWFFKKLREFKVSKVSPASDQPSPRPYRLSVETDKGNIIFEFDRSMQ